MDNRTINDKYAEIGQRLIESEEVLQDIANSQVTIIYLSSEHKKMTSGKRVFGQCEKVAEKYKWGIPCDFTITLFEPNIESFTDEQLEVLIFHELLHVGIEFCPDGLENYSIKPHDLEDFKYIIDRFGTDWCYVEDDDVEEVADMRDFNSIGKRVEGNEGDKCHYPFRLDTYGCGCSHDCKYCYAKSLLEFRGLWNPENPSVADISKITKEIKKLPREVIRLGGMTDCFQPIEKLHRVTYKTIKVLNRYRIPYLIVTKSAIIGDDEYVELMDKDLAHIQVTVTTTDDELSKSYEKASVPSDRIKAIKKLQEKGFDVQLRLSPFIPQYIDFDVLNNLGIDKICIEFLRVNNWIEKWFDIDYSEYTLKQGGYKHLPLSKKKEYISRITGFKEMTVCEDESEAYEYWKKNFNNNPDDCCNLRRVK